MYSPVTRLLFVLNLLQSRPTVSAAYLAERLEVNPRSVRRYIIMLQNLGVPVESEQGRYGGYRLRPGYKLPPLMWTEGEALAITLGLRAAHQLGLAHTLPIMESALAKVERVLPISLREQVQAIQEMTTLDLEVKQVPEYDISSQLALLSLAAHRYKRVELSYYDSSGTQTQRHFDCYGLVYRHDRWYAVGYCHLRLEKRVLRLDRITEVRIEEEEFSRPEGFDCLSYALQSFASVPAQWRVEVLLQAPLGKVRDYVPGEFATLEETAEGVLFRAYSDNLDAIARFLVSLGFPFKVQHPAELQDALRQLAKKIQESIDFP